MSEDAVNLFLIQLHLMSLFCGKAMERAKHSTGNRNPMKMDVMFEGDINGINPHLMTPKEMKKVKINISVSNSCKASNFIN